MHLCEFRRLAVNRRKIQPEISERWEIGRTKRTKHTCFGRYSSDDWIATLKQSWDALGDFTKRSPMEMDGLHMALVHGGESRRFDKNSKLTVGAKTFLGQPRV